MSSPDPAAVASSSSAAAPPAAAPPAPFQKKDASHGAFYAGFFKGMFSAFDGMLLFASSKQLRRVFWSLLAPMRNAQIAYVATGVLIFLLLRDPADDASELFWTISRWGRIVTVLTTFLLEKKYHANSIMFFEALNVLNPSFAQALKDTPKTKTSLKDKWNKVKRVAKLTLFKATGAIINRIFPGGKYIAIPAVKFVSMRPVLGAPVAAGLASIHAIPVEFLESSHVDDALVSIGEAILDADELGTDATREFQTRLDSEETRHYFAERYRGYLTGCGFVYSLLEAVPLLGIPMSLIAECGAACVVTDIVKRNLDKENRRPLVCEDKVNHDKTS